MNGNGGETQQSLNKLEAAIAELDKPHSGPLKKSGGEMNSVAAMVDELSAFSSQMGRYSNEQGEFRARVTNEYLRALAALTAEWANKMLSSLRHEMRDIEGGIGQLPERK
jgi:hypothetical protein